MFTVYYHNFLMHFKVLPFLQVYEILLRGPIAREKQFSIKIT